MAPHCCVSQAFRRRFAGVSQCFADVSRMFRGCFAGRFARFARVSRMFRKNSRRLRAVNPCSAMAAHRVMQCASSGSAVSGIRCRIPAP